MPDCPPDYYATAEQVAADQRRDVAAAVRELGAEASAEQVSRRVVLAVGVVRRRMAELDAERGPPDAEEA